jgi:uncharacterized membrane protein
MKIRAVTLLIVLQVILAGYLMYMKAQSGAFCVAGNACDVVQQSIYGELFGVHVSTLGFIAFGLLFILHCTSHWHPYNRTLYFCGVLLGGIGALYFIGIQVFVLQAYCSTCMVIDVSMLIVTWLEYRAWRKSY